MRLKCFQEYVVRNFTKDEHQEVNEVQVAPSQVFASCSRPEGSASCPGLPDDQDAALDRGFLAITAAQIKETVEPVIKHHEREKQPVS